MDKVIMNLRSNANMLPKKTWELMGRSKLQWLPIDEPRYCNKNAATPKAFDFNYQLGVRTNLKGINTICATYNVSFLCCHERKEMIPICRNETLNLKMLVK